MLFHCPKHWWDNVRKSAKLETRKNKLDHLSWSVIDVWDLFAVMIFTVNLFKPFLSLTLKTTKLEWLAMTNTSVCSSKTLERIKTFHNIYNTVQCYHIKKINLLKNKLDHFHCLRKFYKICLYWLLKNKLECAYLSKTLQLICPEH